MALFGFANVPHPPHNCDSLWSKIPALGCYVAWQQRLPAGFSVLMLRQSPKPRPRPLFVILHPHRIGTPGRHASGNSTTGLPRVSQDGEADDDPAILGQPDLGKRSLPGVFILKHPRHIVKREFGRLCRQSVVQAVIFLHIGYQRLGRARCSVKVKRALSGKNPIGDDNTLFALILTVFPIERI
ncbi:hypothetical protein K491DRAFT_673722 [Lophiostoma macrostomum CBS 122681]|uniref:Uncharacterized protein n=1 Tax=Lophiostoma macrostomum CBS 122681 TaxID=1314788 RepID=A0A6A6TP21_9PLEO|nr:hypothetical protein K491DRAFT_673722 [Lophiostoma macrostomum CBS 122681]